MKTDGFKYYKYKDCIYKVDAKTLETWAYAPDSTRWKKENERWGENKHVDKEIIHKELDKHATELTREEAFLELL